MKPLLLLSAILLALAPLGCKPAEEAPIHGVPLYQINHQRLFDVHGVAEIVSSDLPFLRVGMIWDAGPTTQLEGRLGLGSGEWTAWQRVEPRWSEGVHFVGHLDAPAGERARRFQLRLTAGPAPLHLIARGIVRLGEPLRAALESTRPTTVGSRTFALGESEYPGLHLRAEWGARPPNCTYTNHSPSLITIHHTAGTAATTATAPATLRQIQIDHQDTNEWCDIGYHYIVDTQGGVWQGRPHTVVGAHTANNNTNNVGICLMGHFNAAQPPAAQMNAAAAVVDWLHQRYGIPKTSTYIKGHRDYKATDCPGHMLYARLSELFGGTVQPPDCTPTGPEICGDGRDNDCNPQTSDTCTTPPPSCIPTGPEICNGIDDDCNNQIDDGDPGGGAYCTVPGKFGPCATGITHCLNGYPVCQSTYTPTPEICNNVDDNCNGTIDEVPGGCGPGCTPQPEICNGLDDDCNGSPDDGNPQGGQVCYPGGSCPVGVTLCQGGAIVCQPQVQTEVCDGKDNDCNGYIDDVPGGCGSTSGCVPSGPEICDKIDNDCNGYTDDVNGGCAPGCVPSGFEVCDNRDNDCNGFTDDVPGGCNSGCMPSGAEICDGKDNDCNGRIDDTPTGCVPGCVPSGSEICDGRDNDCNGLNDDVPGGCGTGPGPNSCVPQPERCNGLDDDCDGFPDEGNPDGGDSCTIYTASLPFGGVMMCISGQLVCRVDDPGTSSFTGALQPIRGAGCSAATSEAARALPAFALLLLLFGWHRRRSPPRT